MKALLFLLPGLLLAVPAQAQELAQGSQGNDSTVGGTIGGTMGGTVGSTVGPPTGGSPMGSTMGSPPATTLYPPYGSQPGAGTPPAYGQPVQPPDGLPGIPYPADGLVLTPAQPGYENDP